MKVAVLGPEGTYTHQAAVEYFDSIEPVFCSSIREAVESEIAVIPFENSLDGGVGEAIDLLREQKIEVTGEQLIEINHVLASKNSLEDIEKVRSHPKALGQCRKIIEENGWESVTSSSTAKAASEIENGEAAICSELAAELNNLEILKKKVQDRDSNTTRFLVLGEESQGGGKTSLILEPDQDKPGLLVNMLSCFSSNEINLSYIQSRPTKEELGKYFFYVEAEANSKNEKFETALKCLENYTKVKVLGSYKS